MSTKRQALHMYLEGLGFRSIGRILGVSNVAVLNWIREFGKEALASRKTSEPAKIIEMDEMHSYIAEKKTTAGYGLLLIDWAKDISILSWAAEGSRRVGSSGTSFKTHPKVKS